jgi:DNA/RNA endonuclease YhcR with UshA esterase domain
MSYEEIVEAAYQLKDGIAMDGEYRLFGTITKIDTPYSADYKNITVTIQVGDLADKPMMCYRLKGDGADKLAVGDKITVEGVIKNYKGTIEFDAGCVLVGMGEVKDQSAMLEAAYALADGIAMTDPMTLTGVISKVDTAYSADYKNVTVTIICDGIEDKPIMCYRLKGDGADTIAVGDTITVTGIMKNYKGTIEFDAGCTLDAFTKAEGGAAEEPVVEAKPAFDSAILFDEAQLVTAAYALADGESIPTPAVLKGSITEIGTPYSAEYKNVTVTIKVADKDIVCYRLKGEGADKLAVGDEIAVVGNLKNYKSTIEFDAGCQLVPAAEAESAAVAVAAYSLLNCETAIADEKTLTGVITSVDTAYSAEYKNVTVTIQVADLADYAIQCFRLSGEGADTIKVGDTITVKGNLSTYDGKVQLAKGTIVK